MPSERLLAEARAARAAGDGERAVGLARSALAAAEGAAPAFLLCVLLLEQGSAEANAMLGTLEHFPDFAPGWDELGGVLATRHQGAARVALQRAAAGYAAQEVASDDAGLAFRLGIVLRRLDDLAGARLAMERAVARDAGLAAAWFGLGLVCQDLGDEAGAVRAFRGALAARADFHEAAFNLGVALQEQGAFEDAMDAYARAWRLRPESFGRIAQALVSPASGRLWLRPSELRDALAARSRA